MEIGTEWAIIRVRDGYSYITHVATKYCRLQTNKRTDERTSVLRDIGGIGWGNLTSLSRFLGSVTHFIYAMLLLLFLAFLYFPAVSSCLLLILKDR